MFTGQFHMQPFEPPNLSDRKLLPGQSVDVEKTGGGIDIHSSRLKPLHHIGSV
jgi:hypothetical protein